MQGVHNCVLQPAICESLRFVLEDSVSVVGGIRQMNVRKYLKGSASTGTNLNSLELTDVKGQLFNNFPSNKRQYCKPLKNTIHHTLHSQCKYA